MNLAIVAAIAYGILALVGGIVGYQKAKSKPSLISGLMSGGLLLIAGIIQLQGLPLGKLLAQIITLGLIIVFTIRLTKTRKFMPAGLMLIAGVIALVMLFA
jgi:uncharacterized membrane protein (UPF0136 family)